MTIAKGFAIGIPTGTLALLRDLDIPDPTHAPYNKFSVRNVAGNLKLVGDGAPLVVWQWDVLSRVSYFRLQSFVGDDASGLVVIQTPKSFARGFSDEWITPNCYMYTPDLSGPDGAPIDSAAEGFANVSFRFVVVD